MNNIPTITKNLLIVNVVVFLATYLFRNMGVDLNNVLGLHFFLAPDFHIYQLFTDNIPMPLEIRGDKLFVVK